MEFNSVAGETESVFVSGGNGFIGSRVVRCLHDQGYQINCLLRASSDTSRLDGISYRRFNGDVRDADSMRDAIAASQYAIHLASLSAWHQLDGPALEDTIIGGARNVLELARQEQTQRVVIVSSILAINGTLSPRMIHEDDGYELTDPGMRYAHAKKAVEDMVGEFTADGLEVIIVNPVETYGPEDHDMVTACNLIDFLNNWPCLTTRGGTAITGVEEVAGAIVSALKRGNSGERYILGGDNLSIRELARLTLMIAGQKKPIVHIPLALLKVVIPMMMRLRLPPPIVPEMLPYLGYYFFTDSTKAVSELDYQPKSAVEVLTPVVKWLAETDRING